MSVPMLLRGMPISASGSQMFFNAINEDNENVLVLIQLNGGNDGLNTIIPLEHYDLLANNRSNLIIPSNRIIDLNGSFGLHPNMSGIKELYDDARLSIVHDVAYPNQNRSHFRSTDIWTSGSPADEVWTNGWLGRYFENSFPEYPEGFPNSDHPDPFALTIGSVVSETCQGTLTNFSLALADPLSISPLSDQGSDEVPDTYYGQELQFLRETIEQANAYGEVISAAAEKGANVFDAYPDTQLGQQLRAISLLISGGLKTKVYIANLGGFDTHANQVAQGDPTLGDHATLMQTLSEAVYAFQQDLAAQDLEERVITMTFSEFGRRIRGNGSFGTDHGTAAPMMFFGSCVNPGFIGDTPNLPDQPDVSDGVPMQFDFRSIYTSLLIDWFGMDESAVSSILEDEFTKVPVITACNQTTPTDDVDLVSIQAMTYPNPFDSWTNLTFESPGGHVRISLFDSRGSEIDLIASKNFTSGQHEIRFDGSHLAAGNYFCRLVMERGVKTIGMVKIS